MGLAPEDRYTDLVQIRLNKEFPGKTFEVLNFALTGGPTAAERDILHDYKDLVNPDLVVVGFFYNDPQPKS